MQFTDEFYAAVPKDIGENLSYRRNLILKAQNDDSLRAQLLHACSVDCLFYFNTFGWVYDPRKQAGKRAEPFVTYPFQDDAIHTIIDAIQTGYDLPCEKSRDMGATWMMILVPEWMWHFHDGPSFLLVSRNEKYVDKTGDMKALFQKLEHWHRHQPEWLLDGYDPKDKDHRQKMHMWHPRTLGTIDGDSTTGDVGRGDRRTAILLDEFAAFDDGYAARAATADTTNCRLIPSTPKGQGNCFFDIIEDANKNGKPKLRLHWTQHPVKSRGMTVKDGSATSPWYVKECARRIHPMEVAQELDIDYLGSDYQYFGAMELRKLRTAYACEPLMRGRYERTPMSEWHFMPERDGLLQLWMNLPNNNPPQGQYVIGADISLGRGSSNSSLCIADRTKCEKVAEYTDPNIEPADFAKLAVALCRWFYGAFLIWESNGGAGGQFRENVVAQGYGNIYFRRNEEKLGRAYSDIPGWHKTTARFATLLGEYRRALLAEEFINHSIESYREADQYVFVQETREIVHARSRSRVDPTGAKENHGDRVVADALCWHGIRNFRGGAPMAPRTPASSMAARRAAREVAKREKVYW